MNAVDIVEVTNNQQPGCCEKIYFANQNEVKSLCRECSTCMIKMSQLIGLIQFSNQSYSKNQGTSNAYYGYFRIDAFYVWMGIATQMTFTEVYQVRNKIDKINDSSMRRFLFFRRT